MAADPLHLKKAEFLSRYCIGEELFAKTGLDWSMLEAICARHAASVPELQATADYIAQRLRQIPAVHSLKVRLKHPEHLIEKIIRKRAERPDFEVSAETYSANITDQ